jgi:nitrogen regulatory protein PII
VFVASARSISGMVFATEHNTTGKEGRGKVWVGGVRTVKACRLGFTDSQ